MGSNCNICWCIIDRDDWEASGSVCGSCIREAKTDGEYGWSVERPKNICSKCDAVIPSNWPHCQHCGGGRKYSYESPKPKKKVKKKVKKKTKKKK